MREVDASLRHTVGTAEILVTVESRDRARRQDVTWIEQLHSKQQGIGASKTIAVSSKPFSPEAERVAESLGIETRVLSAVQDSDIGRWAQLLEVTQQETEISDLRILIERWGSEPLDEPADKWLKEIITQRGFDAPFVSVPEDDRLRSPLDVLRQRAGPGATLPADGRDVTVTLAPQASLSLWMDPAQRALVEGVPGDGTVVDREVPIDFDQGRAFLQFGGRSWEIKRITLRYQAQSRSVPPGSRDLFLYKSVSGPLADVAEGTYSLGPGYRVSLLQVRREGSRPGGAGNEG